MNESERALLLQLQDEQDFLAYLELLRKAMPLYLIIITVSDTGAGPFFKPEHAAGLRQLGLQVDLFNKYRQPYLAVINKGKVIREKTTDVLTEPVTLRGKINQHDFFAYSGGFLCQIGAGMRSIVMIDGKNYGVGRGFNFAVYDIDQDKIVDCRRFDTYLGQVVNLNRLGTAIREVQAKGAAVATLQTPFMSIRNGNNLSPHEKLLTDIGFKPFATAGNTEVMRQIYQHKELLFQQYHDSFESFFSSFQTPEAYIGPDGSRRYADYNSVSLNTRHGLRVTLGQPENPKRAVFLVGNCVLYGVGNADAHSPASLLQNCLNERAAEESFIVHNYAFICGSGQELLKNTIGVLRSLPVKRGDVVIVGTETSVWNVDCCDLSLKGIRPHSYGEIFADTDSHLTPAGNQLIAEGLFSFLSQHHYYSSCVQRKASPAIATENHEVLSPEADEAAQLNTYKQKLTKIYHERLRPVVGSIVVNCNPFTKGHRYLVEQALAECDKLIVFVVEEDKSYFPFVDRLALVKENLADLKDVLVLPSGQFILSSRTFKEYFNKESLQERKIDASMDVTLFGREIAPCLDISIRFAGEEPLDKVTAQYNAEMRHLLRQYDVKFVEIPRLRREGMPISASQVRRLLKERDFRNIRKLVPDATYRYLRRFASAKA